MTRNRIATRFIVIHYSATPPTDNLRARDIDRQHRAAGLLLIGYHFVVCRDGSVEPGRPEATVGAHSPDVDTISLGVLVVGGVAMEGQPAITQEQRDGLLRLLVELRERYPEAAIRAGRGFTTDTLETHEPTRSDPQASA